MTTQEEMITILHELKVNCYMEMQRAWPEGAPPGWCGMAWDTLVCWNVTRPGSSAIVPCPHYIQGFNTGEYAQRYCTQNGTWWHNPDVNSTSGGWTNYSSCLSPDHDLTSHASLASNLVLFYTVGYSVSLVSLVVAVIIMLYWRRLHCKSNTLHLNLFLAFILRASMSFMKDRLFVGGLGLPQDVRQGSGNKLVFLQEGTHWECKTLYTLFMFAISASQTWMLMEGLYLYLLIHKTMATERIGVTPYVLVGWALPWTFLIPWIVVKYNFENLYCWNMQSNPAYFWIMKGPWTAIVVINFLFFLDINRVLVTRVMDNRRHAGRSQYRKIGKFVLVLIPLFGIMYIVLNVAFPSEVNAEGYNVVYLYVEMGYNSFQGFILALLFCFLNEEVHTELRRSWHQHRSRRNTSKLFQQSSQKQQASRSSAHAPSPGHASSRGGHKTQHNGRKTTDGNGYTLRFSQHSRRPILSQTLSNQASLSLPTTALKEVNTHPNSFRVQNSSPGPPGMRHHYIVINGKDAPKSTVR